MPAKSVKQQRFFGMVYSSPQKQKQFGISKDTARDFAATSTKNLPESVDADEQKKKAPRKFTFPSSRKSQNSY